MKKTVKRLVTSLLFMFLLSFIGTTFQVNAQQFIDVPDSNVHAESINRLQALNIINGYGNGYFGINDPIKREHAILMIYKLLKDDLKAVRPYSGFTDVPNNHTNLFAIKWAYETGLIDGSNGKFNPNQYVTREQMAKILVKGFKLSANQTYIIKDVSNARWSYEYVNILRANNLTYLNDGKFNPTGNTKRGEMASFLIRTIDFKNAKPQSSTTPPVTTYYDSGWNMKWKVEEGAKTLHMKGYTGDTLVGEFVKGSGMQLQGILIGMTRQQVITAKSGKFTNSITYKNGTYRLENVSNPTEMKDKLIFEENNFITTVFLDIHQKDKVVGILSVQKSKYVEKPYYYAKSTSLRDSYEALMVILINQSRKQFNVPTLTYTPQWNTIARKHSTDMLTRQYFNHLNPEGQSPADRFRAGGLTFTYAAENISYGYETVIHAHEAFMNSEGHRMNNLSAMPMKVFVGADFASNNALYFTVNFYK